MVPWTHTPTQLFLAAGTEPGDMSCGGQGGMDKKERECERKTFMRAVSYQGVEDYSCYFFTAAHHLCGPGGCTHLQSSDVKDSKLRE